MDTQEFDVDQIQTFWLTEAEEALQVADHLMEKADYSYALFFGHLAIEKLLKALYAVRVQQHAPPIHNLVRLAKGAGLELDEARTDALITITAFNLEARYPDIKRNEQVYPGIYGRTDDAHQGVICMVTVPASIAKSVERFLAEVKRRQRVAAAYLYGSQTKGIAAEWSDIDLAIISPDFSADLFQEQLNLMRLAAQIDDRIEPRPFRPDDFNTTEPLVNEIKRTGVQVV
jgi:HEPN domain-containing protein